MQRVRDQLLAGAALADDQHVGVGVGDRGDGLEHALEPGPLAQDLAVGGLVHEPAPQLEVLGLEVALLHRVVCLLQIAGVSLCIEKRRAGPLIKPCTQCGQSVRFARQSHGQIDIGVGVRHHQFGKACAGGQACPDAAGKMLCRPSQQRHASAQGVARRRMRIDVVRIQEQSGMPHACKMFVAWFAWREQHAFTSDAGGLEAAAQPGLRVSVAAQQPQHRIRNFTQNASPGGKNLRLDFVELIEAAVDESRLRQAQRGALRGVRQCVKGIVHLVAGRQVDELLGKLRFASHRCGDRVGDEVIGKAYAERIVEYRQKNGPFKRVEDLLNVRGIGEKTFDRIKDRLTLGKS